MPSARAFYAALTLPVACLVTALLGSPAFAQETPENLRWVSDTLSTYVRSGPNDSYRVLGTYSSGTRLQLLRSQGDYSQVRTENGNTVWIASRDLQDTPAHGERLPQLEQHVEELNRQLKNIDEDWKNRVQGMQETLDARKKLIDELQASRTALDHELNQRSAALREVQAQLGNEQKQLLMRYMLYGGGIAGSGLLLGLLLPTLLRVKRKRSDQWI
jgi:SH3 domain protein